MASNALPAPPESEAPARGALAELLGSVTARHDSSFLPKDIDLHLLVTDSELYLQRLWVPQNGSLHFFVDDIAFEARHSQEKDSVRLHIWATLGYLPFSVESPEKRRLIMRVMEATRSLRSVRFGLNAQNQIVVSGVFQVASIQPPQFIFVSLVAMLQEALPFIRLVGQCL